MFAPSPKLPSPTRAANAERAIAALAALALGLAAACTKTVAPAGAIEPENKNVTVEDVNIRGNRAETDTKIIEGLALQPSRLKWTGRESTAFDPVTLEIDRRRIESYYRKLGYHSAKVKNVVTVKQGNRVGLYYVVTEGERSTISRLAVSGMSGIEELERDEILDISGLELGAPLVYDEYEAAIDRIVDHLSSRGHVFATVDGRIEVDRDEARAGVLLAVDPGPRVRFGETTIEGAVEVSAETVLDRIDWTEGEIADPKALERTRRAILATGLFSVVRFELEREEPLEVADVRVLLTEAKRHEVRLGFGAGLDQIRYELRTRAGYTERGFLHPLLMLRLEARPSYAILRSQETSGNIGGEAEAELIKEDFLDAPGLRLSNLVAYSVNTFAGYSIQGPRYSISLHKAFDMGLQLGLGWQMRYQNFFNVNDALAGTLRDDLGIRNPYRLGIVEETVALDLRDDPIFTRSGLYAEVRLTQSSSETGSAFDYMTAIPELRGYVPAADRWVVAARVRYGRAFLGSSRLPITQRYYAGGASSHRGFPFQGLSPSVLDSEGDQVPFGGEELIETSLELRYDVWRSDNQFVKGVGLVGFADGGDVGAMQGALQPTDLHWAGGLGLRLPTIVGPARLDFGYRLNRYGMGEPLPGNRFAWHLSIGEAF